MSNKPKIYAFCPAGCKWETVHKEDFEKSVTYVEIAINDNIAVLTKGKKYKIFDNPTATSRTLKVIYHYIKSTNGDYPTVQSYEFTLPTIDTYDKYLYFKLLNAEFVKVNPSDTFDTQIQLTYEINDTRHTEFINQTVNTDAFEPVTSQANELEVNGAYKVCVYNEDANVTLESNTSQMIFNSLAQIGYAEPTGDLNLSVFNQYCNNFPQGARCVVTVTQIETYPKLYADVVTALSIDDDITIYSLEIVNTANQDGTGYVTFIARFGTMDGIECREYYSGEWHKVYPNTPLIETKTIASSVWADLTDKDPFKYKADVVLTNLKISTLLLELINDNAVSFANYGFSIGNAVAATGTVTIYALKKPNESITLTFGLEGCL